MPAALMPVTNWGRRDYRHWIAKETVTLTLSGVGTGSDADVTVTGAIAQRVPGRAAREARPMGAKYLSREQRWQVAGYPLDDDVELLAGDELTSNLLYGDDDSGTVTWVVQGVDYGDHDEVWTLDTLRLALHPRLADVVTIQRATVTVDDAGGEVWDFGDSGGAPNPDAGVYVDEPAAVFFTGRTETELHGAVGGRERWEVVLGRQVTITTRDRVLYETGGGVLVLEIDDVQSLGQIGELPLLVCSRQP